MITDSKIYIPIKFGTVGQTGFMLVKYGKVGLLTKKKLNFRNLHYSYTITSPFSNNVNIQILKTSES